jgi:hypothetical protein
MANTTLVVNGFSVLDSARVNANMSGGSGGEIMIHEGDPVFEANDIVVIEVTNALPNGELTYASRITRVTIYENATDYLNDVAKYTYTADSTAKQGTIYNGTTGMGDGYLRFRANGLTSTDPDAPDLNNLLLAPGQDLSNIEGTPIQIRHQQSFDYDGDSVIDTGTTEVGNGLFNTDNNLLLVICVARGTLIHTPAGGVPVERLSEGDLVLTLDAGPQPIRWIGSRRVEATGRNAPIRIRAGALGNLRDLWVSPNHRMLLRGPRAELLFGEPEVLVAAKHLVNDGSIRVDPRAEIEYFHFLFDAHHIVWAEACPTESLFPGTEALKAVDPEAHAEIVELFPELRLGREPGRLSRYELNRREAQVWRLSA